MFQEDTFRAGEVARLAGCSPATIKKYADLLGIKPVRVGARRTRRFTPAEVKTIVDYLHHGIEAEAAQAGRV